MVKYSSLVLRLGFVVVVLALVGLASDASARGRTGAATVDCDAGDSLQAALNKGFDGMTFNVAGDCDEVITIELNNVVIDGRGLDPARRANIFYTGVDGADNPALVRVRGSNVLIKNMTIRDGNNSGIAVQLSSSLVLKRNMIRNNDKNGVVVTSGSHAFIGSFIGAHSLPDNNCVGCIFAGTQGNVIKFNGTGAVGAGIVARLGAAVDVFHNQILKNHAAGISLSNGGSADIDGNDILDNGGAGIRLRTNASVRLDADVFHGKLGGSEPINKISGNDDGINCRLGGAISGNTPDFGTGNPAPAENTDINDCHIATSLEF